MKVVKYIVAVLFILSALGGIFKGEVATGLCFLILGVVLLPPISDNIKEKVKLWQSRGIRYVAYAVLLIIGSAFIDRSGIDENSSSFSQKEKESKTSSNNPYPEYATKTKEMLNVISEEEKSYRQRDLTKIKQTATYDSLVNKRVVSADYIPVINLIANGISYTFREGGAHLDNEVLEILKRSKDEKDKLTFAENGLGLSHPNRGGLTPELIDVFERYRKKYKLYGHPSELVDGNMKVVEKIEYSYDFTPIFFILEPKNKKVLDAVFEARKEGISQFDIGDGDYLYPQLATKKGYNDYLREVYPKSKYFLDADYEITARELYQVYEANEIAADEKYKGKKLAVTGTISDIGNDILNDSYIILNAGSLFGIQCYLDKEVVSKLRKGQKVVVIGKCTGLFGSVGMKSCKIWK